MLYNFENQVLFGTILGGSSLVRPPKGKNYYLSMRSKDAIWLQYKMEVMQSLFKNKTLHRYGSTYRCNSLCKEELTEIYHNFYDKNKRKITMELLNSLRDSALAIWFLDSGSKTGRGKKNAYINTTRFGKTGSEIILRYFNEVDIPCNVNHDGNRMKVLFTVDGTISFLKTTAHRFPPFMHHRI